MPGYGNGTDYFGFAGTDLKLAAGKSVPHPVSTVDAEDENGNKVGSGSHASGPGTPIECEYDLVSGTLNLNTFALGLQDAEGHTTDVLVELEVTTGSGQWPRIVCRGITGASGMSDDPVFTGPDVTLTGRKTAQGLLFTVGSDCRLTGSTLKFGGEMSHVLAGTAVAAMQFSGAVLEVTGQATEIEGVVAWTPDGDLTVTQAPGPENGGISWGTSSFAGRMIVEPDVEE